MVEVPGLNLVSLPMPATPAEASYSLVKSAKSVRSLPTSDRIYGAHLHVVQPRRAGVGVLRPGNGLPELPVTDHVYPVCRLFGDNFPPGGFQARLEFVLRDDLLVLYLE